MFNWTIYQIGFFYGGSVANYPTTDFILFPLLLVKNHGIPQHIISDALKAGKYFFNLPLERKQEVV